MDNPACNPLPGVESIKKSSMKYGKNGEIKLAEYEKAVNDASFELARDKPLVFDKWDAFLS